MKWFKHISKSRNDALIRDSITLFGLAGEHVFWRTIELMADEFDTRKPGFNRFLVKSWSKNYEVSVRKTIKILNFFKKRKSIFFVIKGVGKDQEILINCPKLRDLADEWTKKTVRKLRSEYGASSGVTPLLEAEAEEEEEEEVNNNNAFSKEKADETSGHYSKKVGDYLAEIDKLSEQLKGLTKFNPYKFNQMAANEGVHPAAIIDSLKAIINPKETIKNQWAYCRAVLKTKSQNYREKEHIIEAEQFKKSFEVSERVGTLIKKLK